MTMWGSPLPLLAAPGLAPPVDIIAAASPSGVASFDIAWGDAAYEEVNILVDQWAPVTTGQPTMLTSSDNGATFDSGASDYLRQGVLHNPDATVNGFGIAGPNLQLTYDAGNGRMLGGTAIGCFLVTVHRPFDAGFRTYVQYWGGYDRNVLSNSMNFRGGGYRDAAGKVSAVRLSQTAGNVSARYVAWGIRNGR